MEAAAPQAFEWIRNSALVIAFIAAFGIGANDVANAYATSVGAKSLTINQAIILAAIFEFSGAYLMGATVTDTVRKGIVKSDIFADIPSVLMLGMLCALVSVAIWLLVASYFEMPVSTTHSIIGAIIGFSLVAKGVDAIQWDKVIQVIASWFISPILSGILAVILYLFVRTFILRKDDSYNKAIAFYPALIAFTIALNCFLIIYKGAPGATVGGTALKKLDIWVGIGVSLGVGILFGLILMFTAVPFMKKRIDAMDWSEKEAVDVTEKDVEKADAEKTEGDVKADTTGGFGSINADVHAVLKDTESTVSKMHERAEVFDAKTEKVFSYLQVFTAMFDSFAHGANDVANSIGPLSAIWTIYEENGNLTKKVPVQTWILALGGVGIVVGLATYGYKIIAAIGVKLVKITPSRGFSIELGAAFVIVVGAKLGLPLSTTHCQVGATVGLGITEGKGGVNWCLLAGVFGGWVITLVVAGAVSALLFAFAAYSPSLVVACV